MVVRGPILCSYFPTPPAGFEPAAIELEVAYLQGFCRGYGRFSLVRAGSRNQHSAADANDQLVAATAVAPPG
jgi:hypothetical protein